jgi:inner membrane protein
MDQLTHTLVGVMLGRAGLNRAASEVRWILPVAAVVPDLDVATLTSGALTYFHYHRGLTHALVMAPVMAAVAVALVWLVLRRKFSWGRAYAAALGGVASHLALDWTNIYGARFQLPFSGQWTGLGILNVVDAWIWMVLLVAVAGPFLARLVSSEMGARSHAGRGYAIFALCFLAVYGFACWILHNRAVAVLESRIYEGATPSRVAAAPNAINPLRWTGVVETAGFFMVHRVNLLEEFDPAAGKLYYKSEPSPATEAAARVKEFQEFAEFSPFLLWRVFPGAEAGGVTRVEAMDLRFGTPEAPRFVMAALFDPNLALIRTRFAYDHRPSPDSPR